MPKIILTDVDECLFDWAGPFESWVRETYPEHCHAPGYLRDYWHVEHWLTCSYQESRELIRQFNGDPTKWPYFKPLPGVLDNVHRLHDDGFKFVAITACDTDEQTWLGRWQNLNEVFGRGVFDTLHCVGLSESKRAHLERYRPAYWVEDKTHHALDGAEVGHKSFLINYQHNERDGQEIPGVTRVNDWHEIYDHIQGDRP